MGFDVLVSGRAALEGSGSPTLFPTLCAEDEAHGPPALGLNVRVPLAWGWCRLSGCWFVALASFWFVSHDGNMVGFRCVPLDSELSELSRAFRLAWSCRKLAAFGMLCPWCKELRF